MGKGYIFRSHIGRVLTYLLIKYFYQVASNKHVFWLEFQVLKCSLSNVTAEVQKTTKMIMAVCEGRRNKWLQILH